MRHWKPNLLAGLVLLAVQSGCRPGVESLVIQFVPRVGVAEVACGDSLEGLGLHPGPVQLMDFRFYVSEVRLVNEKGREVPFVMDEDSPWQYRGVALLDFENATGPCEEKGTAQTNGQIIGRLPKGRYKGLVFNLGVPFGLNHLDMNTAPSPLNIGAMFWSWQTGYKFLRVEVQADVGKSQPAFYFAHLGSTGCASLASVMAPEKPCKRPNLARIHLKEYDPKKDIVVADLAGLLSDIAITETTLAPPGCMADHTDADCPRLFENLGLSAETGNCLDNCSGQTFFRVISAQN